MKSITMKKYLCGNNGWSRDGEVEFIRASRWIKIKQNYSPHSDNNLYYYCRDENGNSPGNDSFDKNTAALDYFTFQGRKYAASQFIALMNPFFSAFGYSYETEEGKEVFLAGYDAKNYYNPLFVEIDETCEHVRVYIEK